MTTPSEALTGLYFAWLKAAPAGRHVTKHDAFEAGYLAALRSAPVRSVEEIARAIRPHLRLVPTSEWDVMDIDGADEAARAVHALLTPAETAPHPAGGDGLEPPGCPMPGMCSCPGGEAELAKRLGNAAAEIERLRAQAATIRIEAIDGVLRHEPNIGASSEEPSLPDIIYSYYKRHLGPSKAETCMNKYLESIHALASQEKADADA